ncbi:hypothetical protein BU17DRAFT_99486 [Hysterangium stoloniferum]|nr:hypothetical protein BU17DRAFT_99486 [Hysterangium stoloniferum]
MTNTTPCAVRAALRLIWPPPAAPYNQGGMSFHTQGRGFSPSQSREFSPPQRPSFSPRPSPSSFAPRHLPLCKSSRLLWVLALVPHAHTHPPRSRDHIITGTCSRVRMLDTGEAQRVLIKTALDENEERNERNWMLR